MVARWCSVFLRPLPGLSRWRSPPAVAAPQAQSGSTPSVAAQTTSESASTSDKLIGPTPDDREVHELTGFVSPSGNVSCMIDANWARCDIIDRDWSPPARPADCEFDYGQGISLAPGERLTLSAQATSLSARRGTAVRRVDQCRGAVLRECPVMDHVPRRPDRPRVFDFSRGVSAVLRLLGAGIIGFVRLHFGGLSSSFATGDDVVRGARM